MPDNVSQITMAREASALTIDDASIITGMSKAEYQRIEDHPLEMTLGELRALCSELNSDGRVAISLWLDSFCGL